MDRTTRETRRQSYDAVLPKREKRCRLILETLGAREMTASEIIEELVAAGEIPYFNRNYVAPRLTEMKQMGILKTVGRRKATNPVATSLYVTGDGNGELVVAEMVPQVPGQLNMDGTQQEQPKLLKLVTHA